MNLHILKSVNNETRLYMLWIQTGACCLTADVIVLVVWEPWHNSGLKDVENIGNLRRMFKHCVWVCLEKRTFQLHVSADHEKKYSLQTVKVKAPSLCWHRLQLTSLSVGTGDGIRETPCGLPWALPGHYIPPSPVSPILCVAIFSIHSTLLLSCPRRTFLIYQWPLSWLWMWT